MYTTIIASNNTETTVNNTETTVPNTVNSNKDVEDQLNKIRDMSISDIENYGADIQKIMSEASNNLLAKSTLVDLGDTRNELDKLSDVAKKQKKMLPLLQTPLKKIKKFQGNFVKIQSKIEEIETSLEIQQNKIDEHLIFMEEQVKNLTYVVNDLKVCEDSLYEHTKDLTNDTDQTRLQVVSSRLRMLNSTRIIAEQAQAEAIMIISEQREAKMQLEQVIKNALPAIQIQAVNSIGIRVNKETQDIIDKTREITGQILIKNATDVKDMAIALQKNRTKSIVDDDKLIKAQEILNEAIGVVVKAAENEANTNIKLVENLRAKVDESQKGIDMLSNKLDYSKEIDTTMR